MRPESKDYISVSAQIGSYVSGSYEPEFTKRGGNRSAELRAYGLLGAIPIIKMKESGISLIFLNWLAGKLESVAIAYSDAKSKRESLMVVTLSKSSYELPEYRVAPRLNLEPVQTALVQRMEAAEIKKDILLAHKHIQDFKDGLIYETGQFDNDRPARRTKLAAIKLAIDTFLSASHTVVTVADLGGTRSRGVSQYELNSPVGHARLLWIHNRLNEHGGKASG